MVRPTRAELERLIEEGAYEDHARKAMNDFCFTITRHEAKQRVWFGDTSVTINRNVAFNFYPRDVRDDPSLEPYPVVRAEHYDVIPVRVRASLEDATTETLVTMFLLSPEEWRSTMDSIERIDAEYPGLRILPDAYFADEPLIHLLTERLLKHPAVMADRASDWPSLLH